MQAKARSVYLPIPAGAIVLRGINAQLNCMFRQDGWLRQVKHSVNNTRE